MKRIVLAVVVLSGSAFHLHAIKEGNDHLSVSGEAALLHARVTTKHDRNDKAGRPATVVKLPTVLSAPRPLVPAASHYPLHYSSSLFSLSTPLLQLGSPTPRVKRKKASGLQKVESASGLSTPTSAGAGSSVSMSSGSSGKATPTLQRRARGARLSLMGGSRPATSVSKAARKAAAKKHGVVVSLPSIEPGGELAISLGGGGEKIYLPEKPSEGDSLYVVYDLSDMTFEKFKRMWITMRHAMCDLRERLFEFRRLYTRLVRGGKTDKLLALCNENARIASAEYDPYDPADVPFKELEAVDDLFSSACLKHNKALTYAEALCMGACIDLSFSSQRFSEDCALPKNDLPIALLDRPECLLCSARAERRVFHHKFNEYALVFDDTCEACGQCLLQHLYDNNLVFDARTRGYVESELLMKKNIVRLEEAFETADYYLRCLYLNAGVPGVVTRGACASSPTKKGAILPERRLDITPDKHGLLGEKNCLFGVVPGDVSPSGRASRYSDLSTEVDSEEGSPGRFTRTSTAREAEYKKRWIEARVKFTEAYEGFRQIVLGFKIRQEREREARAHDARKDYFETKWGMSVEKYSEETDNYVQKFMEMVKRNNEMIRIAAQILSLDCERSAYFYGEEEFDLQFFTRQKCSGCRRSTSYADVLVHQELCTCGVNLIIPKNYQDLERFLKSVNKNIISFVEEILTFKRELRAKS